MDNRLLILKALGLAHRKNMISGGDDLGIQDVVNKAIREVKINDVVLGQNIEKDMIEGLIDLIRRVLNYSFDNPYDTDRVLADARVICHQDPDYMDELEDNLTKDKEIADIKKSVVYDINALNEYHSKTQLGKLLYKASDAVNRRGSTIEDLSGFLTDLIGKLEASEAISAKEEPGMISSIVFGKDDDELLDAFEKTKEIADGGKVWKLGWEALNQMYQGGPRPGNFMFISALQHNYKTGFSLSIFKQLAIYNKPETFAIDKTKKQAIMRVTFEDPMSSNLQFLFQNIKFNETGKKIDVRDYSSKEMKDTVIESMTVNGWEIIMHHRNPDVVTYRDVINMVTMAESDGYEVSALVLDYLPMISTRGCDRDGPMGTDLVSLFRKIRAFGTSKDMLIITPGQLNTEAKSLVNGEVSSSGFLEFVSGRGMFAGSKQLSNEVDINMYIHKVKVGDKSYLHCLSDKHRYPGVISDSYKSFYLPFPEHMPIPDDYGKDKTIHYRRLPSGNAYQGM